MHAPVWNVVSTLILYPRVYVTGVASASGGHVDNFGKGSTPSLENKLVVPRGQPVHVAPEERARTLSGALAYPRFKVATTCSTGADIEFHDLLRELHFTSQVAGAGRVGFQRSTGRTFMHAAAVCDWPR